MAFTLSSRGSFRNSISTGGEQLLVPIDIESDHHFSLQVKARGDWPLVSIATPSGAAVQEASSYGSDQARTGLIDPGRIGDQSLVANVSMQGGRTGRFKLTLLDLGSLDDIRDEVIRFTNKRRRKHGLDRLAGDTLLHQAAQGHADEMDAVGRYLGHDSADGRDPGDRIDETGYSWRAYRENVATGQPTAKQVVKAWMRSPGHRDNLLSDNVTEIGIGFAIDDESGSPYWVQKFAAPL